jgi:hypothetical protein
MMVVMLVSVMQIFPRHSIHPQEQQQLWLQWEKSIEASSLLSSDQYCHPSCGRQHHTHAIDAETSVNVHEKHPKEYYYYV